MTAPVKDVVEAVKEIKELVLAEREKGNVVFQALPGQFMAVSIEEFVKQPVDGLLYDLNRSEEVVLTFIDASDYGTKWVNDFAVAQVIRHLATQVASMEAMKKDKERLDFIDRAHCEVWRSSSLESAQWASCIRDKRPAYQGESVRDVIDAALAGERQSEGEEG